MELNIFSCSEKLYDIDAFSNISLTSIFMFPDSSSFTILEL